MGVDATGAGFHSRSVLTILTCLSEPLLKPVVDGSSSFRRTNQDAAARAVEILQLRTLPGQARICQCLLARNNHVPAGIGGKDCTCIGGCRKLRRQHNKAQGRRLPLNTTARAPCHGTHT